MLIYALQTAESIVYFRQIGLKGLAMKKITKTKTRSTVSTQRCTIQDRQTPAGKRYWTVVYSRSQLPDAGFICATKAAARNLAAALDCPEVQ